MEAFKTNGNQEEKTFDCPKCDKKFFKEDELKTHEGTHSDICQHYRSGTCVYGGRGINKEGKCPHSHPRKCAKFLNDINGCSLKDCAYLHPTVCKFIRNDRPCMVAGCTLAHPVSKSKPGANKEKHPNAAIVTKGSKTEKFKAAKRGPPPSSDEENNNRSPPKKPEAKKPNASFLGQEQILKMMETLTMNVTKLSETMEARMASLENHATHRSGFNQRNFNSPWWRN